MPTCPCAVSAYETIIFGLGNIFIAPDTRNDASFFLLLSNTSLFNSITMPLFSSPAMPLHSGADAGDPKVTTPTSSFRSNNPYENDMLGILPA